MTLALSAFGQSMIVCRGLRMMLPSWDRRYTRGPPFLLLGYGTLATEFTTK